MNKGVTPIWGHPFFCLYARLSLPLSRTIKHNTQTLKDDTLTPFRAKSVLRHVKDCNTSFSLKKIL